ncbi:UNVERIFIED_CONTAM: hypothetical protein K2H54_029416 [Gekko kuhli]
MVSQPHANQGCPRPLEVRLALAIWVGAMSVLNRVLFTTPHVPPHLYLGLSTSNSQCHVCIVHGGWGVTPVFCEGSCMGTGGMAQESSLAEEGNPISLMQDGLQRLESGIYPGSPLLDFLRQYLCLQRSETNRQHMTNLKE